MSQSSQAAIAKYCRVGGLSNRNFTQFWRLGSPGPKCSIIKFLVSPLFLSCICLSSCALTSRRVERERELFDICSYKDTNPIGSGPYPVNPFNLHYLCKGLLSKYSHLGSWGFCIWIGVGNINFQSIIII